MRHRSLVLSAAAPDLGRGVTPLGRCPSGMVPSWLLPRPWTWGALGSIITNKASGGDGIPNELFQIPKDNSNDMLLPLF